MTSMKKSMPKNTEFVVMPRGEDLRPVLVAAKNPPLRDPFSRPSLKSLMPVVAGTLLVIMLMQLAVYLNTAKSASGIVLGEATSAYDDLDAANKSLEERDFGAAKSKFSSAQQNLADAQSALDKYRVLTMVAPPARSADDVLTGAYFLAEAGKNLTTAMQLFDELSVDSAGISTENFTEKLEQNRNLLRNSLLLLTYAKEKFDKANSLPGDYQETLDHAKGQINLLEGVLTDLVNLEDLFLSFFGTQPRTYLLAFQNYDEIRATGGFIGTYGVLKYDNGSIKKLKIESVYNLDGSLTKQIAAPGPFQPYIKKWGMRDSNWFADFPTTAKKLLSFFETSSETADGVIALTPKIFEDMLRLVGPIEMTGYGVTLTPENFQDVVQTQTSIVYDKELNQPKKFLDDFAPLLLDKMSALDKEQWFQLFQVLKDNFAQKHVLVYSTDQDTQEKILNMGFDGGILEAEHDYISVVNSNLGGTKTDLDILQSVNLVSQVESGGEIINTVKITRRNTSAESNRNFMRVLVPKGSKLIEHGGFAPEAQFSSFVDTHSTDDDLAMWDRREEVGDVAVRTESGKTEFTGWTITNGGETTEVTLKYVLPMEVDLGLLNRKQPHSILFQKQSGTKETSFTGELVLDGSSIEWSTQNSERTPNGLKFSGAGMLDEYWGMVISK